MMKASKPAHRLFFILLFVLNSSSLFAQKTFRYIADLQKPDSNAFYKVLLTPAILAKCNINLSDLRIIDKDGKFIPYIFGSQSLIKDQSSFDVFPQTGKVTETDTSTLFIIEHPHNYILNQFYLQFRNTSVHRTAKLSGSDDLKFWYAIKEDIDLEESRPENNGTFMQLINFPASTYRYLKIEIKHKNNEPVAILKAGIYKQQAVATTYMSIENVRFVQHDSAAISYLHIYLKDEYRINSLRLNLSGARYYKRDIRIYQTTQKRKDLIFQGSVNSADAPLFKFDLFAKTKLIDVEIDNGDNPPLKLDSVLAEQLDQSVTGYLEEGKQYRLLFGDSAAVAPDYDLKFFTDSLREGHALLFVKAIKPNPLYTTKQSAITKAIPSWIMWAAIIITVLILGLLTLKMTTEVKKKSA